MLPIISNTLITLLPTLRSALSDTTASITRDFDHASCILCDNCVSACEAQGLSIYEECDGAPPTIAEVASNRLADSLCIGCGQCTLACPVGCITEKDDTPIVEQVLANKGRRHVVAMTAPAFRVGVAEAAGLAPGTDGSAALVPALKELGFDAVFDVTAAADVTIVEEATELIERLQNKHHLPLFTSCCPGWVNYVEKVAPDMIPHLSTCKSPQGMAASLIREFYAREMGIPSEDVFIVSLMPCTGKKTEITRPQLSHNGIQDTDVVLTAREAQRLLTAHGIDLADRATRGPHAPFDHFLGECSGGADLFGQSGGVMEAALRYAAEEISGTKLPSDHPLLEFEPVRGVSASRGVKVASVQVPNGPNLRVAVVHGGENMAKIVEEVRADPDKYDFIEVMACPGGCVNGGGQPRPQGEACVEERAKGLQRLDRGRSTRVSNGTSLIQEIYKKYLGKPGQHLMHTSYVEK